MQNHGKFHLAARNGLSKRIQVAMRNAISIYDRKISLSNAMDKMTEEHDKGHEVDFIYLSFQKAADTELHGRVLRLLEQYKTNGKTVGWIEILAQTTSCIK